MGIVVSLPGGRASHPRGGATRERILRAWEEGMGMREQVQLNLDQSANVDNVLMHSALAKELGRVGLTWTCRGTCLGVLSGARITEVDGKLRAGYTVALVRVHTTLRRAAPGHIEEHVFVSDVQVILRDLFFDAEQGPRVDPAKPGVLLFHTQGGVIDWGPQREAFRSCDFARRAVFDKAGPDAGADVGTVAAAVAEEESP